MLLSAIALVLAIFLLYTVFIKPYKEIDKLPGPSTLELIKQFYHYGSHEGIAAYFGTLNEKYGPVVKIWLKPLKPMIITTDMEYVEKIFKSDEIHITPVVTEMKFMRNGIATIPHYDLWKKDKDLINKAITRKYIAGKLSIYDENYNEFLDIIRKNIGKLFDVERPLHRITLNIIMHTINDSNIELTEQEVQNYAKYRKGYFNLLLERVNTFPMMGLFHKFTRSYKLMEEYKESIINFSSIWLERFKAVGIGSRDEHNLVYAMLNGGMPEERVVDNINTLIQGGHDSTTIPLGLGFLEMARNPDIQRKILDEIYAVLGTDKTNSITLHDLDEMEYLQAFVKESLRIYMPAPYLDRKTLHETHINGLKIPKGMKIMFYMSGILTSAQNYEDPLVFNPDRFMKGNMTAQSQKAYLPFGYGIKTCPGKNIGYAAMKLLIIKTLREFEICPLEQDYNVELISDIFFRSRRGIPIMFKNRNH